MIHRRLISLVLAVVLAALPVAPALAQDNAATAVNTEDEALVFRLAFDLHRVTDGVVDQSNAAVAYASCEECRTIAIAIQVVMVMGDVGVVTPQNVAVAINDSCTACETLAFAYQLVFGTAERTRLTGEGHARINEIRRALRALGRSDAPLHEIRAELGRLMLDIHEVLATETVPVGPPRRDAPTQREAPTPEPSEPSDAVPSRPEATTTPAPEQTATPEPDATATPAPEATVTPAPDETPASAPEPTAAPLPDETATPVPEATATPAPEEPTDPAPDEPATVVPDATATPSPVPAP